MKKLMSNHITWGIMFWLNIVFIYIAAEQDHVVAALVNVAGALCCIANYKLTRPK